MKHTGAISRMLLILRWGTLLLVFIVLMSGCGPTTSITKWDPQFSEKDLLTIVPGETTKKELLGLLGPPAAMTRKDMNSMIFDPQTGTTTLLPPESFFEMFSLENGPGMEHVIYYYQSIKASQHGFFIYFFFGIVPYGPAPIEKYKPRVDLELWVLIDNEKGIVIDYAYKQN